MVNAALFDLPSTHHTNAAMRFVSPAFVSRLRTHSKLTNKLQTILELAKKQGYLVLSWRRCGLA